MNSPAAAAACLLAMLLATPATAAQCSWASEQGDHLTMQPGEILIEELSGDIERCTLKGNGPGNPIMTAICDDHHWPFFSIKSEPSGDFDIVIFRNTAWYAAC